MTLDTSGATRWVLLAGRWAAKVPRPTSYRSLLLGLLANMQEARFSAFGDDRVCPVVFALPRGLLVIMPRCAVLTRNLTAAERERFFGAEYIVPAEDKASSFGWLNGRLVAIDYGS